MLLPRPPELLPYAQSLGSFFNSIFSQNCVLLLIPQRRLYATPSIQVAPSHKEDANQQPRSAREHQFRPHFQVKSAASFTLSRDLFVG